MKRTIIAGALLAVLSAFAGQALEAQLPANLRDYPLSSLKKSGDIVAPFFDGWFDNGDGTITYSFGFLNRNTEEIVDIPLGENNYIEPAQYDGVQPTHFPVYDRRGFQGKWERGTFGITVPDHQTEVWWTLTHAGRSYSVPGRATSPAYELSRAPAAFGSLSPALRFDPTGPESRGPEGHVAQRVMASVGTAVTLSALVQDRGQRYDFDTDMDVYPVRATFILHQGPAPIVFEPESVTVGNEESVSEGGIVGTSWGTATTQATFTESGEYVVRIRVDNFGAPDSKFDNMCCWTNAYVPVTVR
ncbi:MAG: hypothetical protein OEO79_10540 [Gemmatimonadota bacterium]|nr:hypothetical protein [Gemmatimonadota bacterium]MDH3422625.1 hypothetical protein [Gemmatimonadota bacterium]